MITKQQKEELIAEITKAVPEILDLKFGCKLRTKFGCIFKVWQVVGNNKIRTELGEFTKEQVKECKIIGRDITLEDVIVVLFKGDKWSVSVHHGSLGCFLRVGCNGIDLGVIKWRLGKPLQDQRDDVWEFLYNLICKK